MLSVNYISNFLERKQVKIDNSLIRNINDFEINEIKNKELNNLEIDKKSDKTYDQLPDDLKLFFGNDVNIFSVNKNIDNKNEIFSFMSSIMSIGNSKFNFFNNNEKKNIIKKFIKKINDELFLNDLYFKYNYVKNKYFSKEKLLKVLIDAYNFKIDENLYLLKKYVCDYLGINIFIIQSNKDTLDKNYKEYYLNNKYSNVFNKICPYYLILKEDCCYYPIYFNESKYENYLKLDEMEKYLDNFTNFYCLNEKKESNDAEINNDKKDMHSSIKKMKIDDLREECRKYNIETTKISEKTNKIINKIKSELMSELLEVI